jgi:uracil-DNA glycosylase
MKTLGTFPFGQQVQEIVQTDRTSKVLFILGVYASAVHTRWMNKDGRTLVHALAVASEPYIFWCGDKADSMIGTIEIPDELGKLAPAKPTFNGPSGIALDNLILDPLGLERKEAWLCDLVPHSCINLSQKKAIEREYLPVAPKYGLPKPTVPALPNLITDEIRRIEIEKEIVESNAKILVLLGDLPIRWFLSYYDNRWAKLSDFEPYGHLHNIHIRNKEIKLLPLAHLRQIARLGQSSVFWNEAHSRWIHQSAKNISQSFK